MARGTASCSPSTARSSRARLSKHDEHGRPTRSRVGTQRHLVTSTDVHHLGAATSPAGIDTVSRGYVEFTLSAYGMQADTGGGGDDPETASRRTFYEKLRAPADSAWYT